MKYSFISSPFSPILVILVHIILGCIYHDQQVQSFVIFHSQSPPVHSSSPTHLFQADENMEDILSTSLTNNNQEKNDESEGVTSVEGKMCSVRMDDGGSDLTNRFKYKVQALMGRFDPPEGTVDDERQTGNIYNALMEFPARFTFTAMGKTKGQESLQEEYIAQVKQVVEQQLVPGQQDLMTVKVSPWGNYTRVSIQTQVEGSNVINTVLDNLGELEMTVMRY